MLSEEKERGERHEAQIREEEEEEEIGRLLRIEEEEWKVGMRTRQTHRIAD